MFHFNTVSIGNHLQYFNNKAPFYEVYYLKLIEPQALWSLWLRYTLCHPSNKSVPAEASVWGIFHLQGQKPLAIKKSYPLKEIDVFHQDSFIHIEDNFLAIEKSVGYLEEKNSSIEWNFEFEDPSHSICLYPYQILYKLPFPKTKFLEPRLKSHATGEFKINHKTYPLNHLPVHQAHIWGKEYADNWTWGNCIHFNEDPTAIFEGLVAQIKLGKKLSPPLALFYFVFDGEVYKANQIHRWTKNKSYSSLLDWNFECLSKNLKFVGHLKRSLDDIAGVEYTGPLGEKRYCHNTMRAQMTLQVFRKNKKSWVPLKKLTSKQAAFETVNPHPNEKVNFVL